MTAENKKKKKNRTEEDRKEENKKEKVKNKKDKKECGAAGDAEKETGGTMTLEEMKQVDIRTVDPDTLVDIYDVVIDTKLPREERIKEFNRQIKNPYCFKCGGTVVKVEFADTSVTIDERMESYLRSL